MIKNNNYTINAKQNFILVASLIMVIAFAIALTVFIISKYLSHFFLLLILPTILAIFLDRNNHKCTSAMIYTFNVIGVSPCLMRLWNSNSVNSMVKLVINNVNSWMLLIYGQLLYMSLPLLIVKLYTAKTQVNSNRLKKKSLQIATVWGIETKKKYNS